MGISLLDCIDADIDRTCEKIFQKITTKAKDLVKVGEEIESEYGIPIINKRISVTPVAIVVAAPSRHPQTVSKLRRPWIERRKKSSKFHRRH